MSLPAVAPAFTPPTDPDDLTPAERLRALVADADLPLFVRLAAADGLAELERLAPVAHAARAHAFASLGQHVHTGRALHAAVARSLS